jgi:hypothetical protein
MRGILENLFMTTVGLVIFGFCPIAAHAQAEHAPDNYGMSNAAPINASAAAKEEFKGSFSLASQVQCGGHKLSAGKYTVAVKTVGESRTVTIQHEGEEIVLAVSKVSKPTDAGKSAVLVRHGPGPGTHTIEAVYVEKLNMLFVLDESGCTKGLDKMFAGVKRVPIS